MDALRAAGVNVYFMTDVPIFSFDVPKALVLYTSRRMGPVPPGITTGRI